MNCAIDPQSRALSGHISLLLVVAVVCLGGSALSGAPSAEHKARKMSKVASELIALHDEYSSYLASGKSGVFKPTNSLVQVIDDRVVIDAVASGDASVLKADLEALGLQQAVAFGRIVSGQLPILAILPMATLPSLNFARAAPAVLQRGGPPIPPRTPDH
jgi:hypothetical protein